MKSSLVHPIKRCSQAHRTTLTGQLNRRYCRFGCGFELLEHRLLLACTPAPDGLISWWPLDETSGTTAADIIDANSGTHLGEPTPVTGKVTGALSFDGIDDHVNVPPSPNLDITGDITVDLWAKRNSFGSNDVVISKGGGTFGTADAPSAYSIQFKGVQIPQGSANQIFAGFERADGSNEFILGPVLTDTTFHHYAYVRSGNTHQLFVDSALVASDTFTGSPGATPDIPLKIGAITEQFTGAADFLDGAVDEVEIFNRALSASEIQAIFNAGGAGKCKATQVEIDIKPGSDPNSINLGSNGNVPVAILSTADFDAKTVDPTTVTLADAGVKVRGNGNTMASEEDVNGDGLLDLVVHVETQGLQVTAGDEEAVLQGETFGGDAIEGSDSVRIVGQLHVVGGPAAGVLGQPLTEAVLASAVEHAITHWTGPDTGRSDVLGRVDIQVADLSGSLLGVASLDTVWVDRDAAGYGWSISSGGVDLLSVVTHEFGHVLGFNHDHHDRVMGAMLAPRQDLATGFAANTATVDNLFSLWGKTTSTATAGSPAFSLSRNHELRATPSHSHLLESSLVEADRVWLLDRNSIYSQENDVDTFARQWKNPTRGRRDLGTDFDTVDERRFDEEVLDDVAVAHRLRQLN